MTRKKGTKVPGSNEAMIWGREYVVSRIEAEPTNVDLNYLPLSIDSFAVSGAGLPGFA